MGGRCIAQLDVDEVKLEIVGLSNRLDGDAAGVFLQGHILATRHKPLYQALSHRCGVESTESHLDELLVS